MKTLEKHIKELLDKMPTDWQVPSRFRNPRIERTRSMYKHQTSRQLIIPEGVAKIWYGAYSTQEWPGDFHVDHKTVYTSIVFPESLREIYARAFYRQNALEIISFPKKLEHIDREAFRGCTRLRRVLLSRSTKVHPTAFPSTTTIEYYGPDK